MVNGCVNCIVVEISVIADKYPVTIKKEQLHGVVEIVRVYAMLMIYCIQSSKG